MLKGRAGVVWAMEWEAEVARLARLAKLSLAREEAEALARDCAAITASFSALASQAASLPDAEPPAGGAPREDAVLPAPEGEADAILAQAPRVDARTRAVLARRDGA